MDRQTFIQILKTLLTSVGVFLVGKNLFGTNLTQEMWQIWLGAIMSIVSVGWSYFDKTLTLESFQATLAQIVLAISAVFVAKGVMRNDQVEAILGIVGSLGIMIYRLISYKKNRDIASGKINVDDLKK